MVKRFRLRSIILPFFGVLFVLLFYCHKFNNEEEPKKIQQEKFEERHFIKEDFCSSNLKKNTKQLDGKFYTKYQSSVLSNRKPFAIDKGFFNIVEKYYSTKKVWLDAGAGTCDTMREIERRGHIVYGIELSEVCHTKCGDFARSGQAFTAGVHAIPFSSNSFDLVWSTEVLEHVPIHFINKSVAEIVRVSRKDIFLTIAMKRSGFDPLPPSKPKIHLSVMPRTFWDAIFKFYGCTVNKDLRETLKEYRFPKATFFPYTCSQKEIPNYTCGDSISIYIDCYAQQNRRTDMCSNEMLKYIDACL